MTDPTFPAIEAAANSGAFGYGSRELPSEAQRKAGTYRMGRLSLHGLPIAIEQPRGSIRSGTDADGKAWTCRLAAHYGYFTGTKGADGEGVDVFVGPDPAAETVYVINQNVGGRFDEHKVVLGAVDESHARSLYLASYARGWRGLASIVAMTIPQFKQWLRSGNTRRPVPADLNSPQGNRTMNRVNWNSDALPEGASLDQVLYQLRIEDGGENLLLDSVSMADILDDSEGVIALDAMVVPVNMLSRRMDLLVKIMERAGNTVKPLTVQVSEPFKQRGVTNVAALFELSDGQTVSIYFHNPDTTPNKLAPTDDLVSWKWLLNKRDITIVVAPERGEDLNPREVARRIMRLAEKNSAAFGRANTKRAERMTTIATLKTEVEGLEAELQVAQRTLETELILADERLIESATKPKPAPEAEFDPTEPDSYAKVIGDEALQLYWQDRLDSMFQGRIVDTRNALRDLGWDGEPNGTLSKNGAALVMDLTQVGGGRNVVGVIYKLAGKTRHAGEDAVRDTLSLSPAELAAEIDGLAPLSADNAQTIDWQGFEHATLPNGTIQLEYKHPKAGVMTFAIRPRNDGTYQVQYGTTSMTSGMLKDVQTAVIWAAQSRAIVMKDKGIEDSEVPAPLDLEPFEHAGRTIYPITVNGHGLRWGVVVGEAAGFGDTLWPTREAAMAEADLMAKRAARAAELAAEELAAKEAASAAAAAFAESTLGKYLATLSPLKAGAARKKLESQVRVNGAVTTIAGYIEAQHAEGALAIETEEVGKIKPMSSRAAFRASNAESAAHEKRMKAAGTKTVYYVNDKDLGAHAYAYAAHLLGESQGEVDGEGSGAIPPALANATPDFTAWLAPREAAFDMVAAIEAAASAEGGTVVWGADPAGTMDAASAAAKALSEENGEDDGEDEWEAAPDEDDEDATLDGDFSGHPFRGNQYRKGSRTSGTAVSATIHAKKTSRAGDERATRTAHRIAHHSHVAASLAVTTGAARRYHRKMARLHAKHGNIAAALDSVELVMDGVRETHATAVLRNSGGNEVGSVVLYDDGSASVRSSDDRLLCSATSATEDAAEGVRLAMRGQNKTLEVNNVESAKKLVFPFMPRGQRAAINSGLNGEEAAYFEESLKKLATTIRNMPETYGQDGKGDEAVAYLHYFKGSGDWYITEKDAGGGDVENVQQQAFGLADLFGDGGELGYISIAELVANGVELDMHWTPKTLRAIRGDEVKPEVEPEPEPKSEGVVIPATDFAMREMLAREVAKALEAAEWDEVTDERVREVLRGGMANGVSYSVEDEGSFTSAVRTAKEELHAENAGSDDVNAGNDELVEAGVLAARENRIAKIDGSDYFTMDFEGDDVVVSDGLRAGIEERLGEKLVEAVVPGLELQVTLVPESEAAKLTPGADTTAEAAKPETDLTRLNALKALAPTDEIRSDDPAALEMLQAKLNFRVAFGEYMRKANKLLRKGDDAGLLAMGFSPGLLVKFKEPDFAGRTGFADYEMSNNSGEISRIRKRIEKLEAERATTVVNEDETAERIGTADPAQDAQLASDRALFQSVIDGSVADILAPALADDMEAAFLRHESDAEMAGLFEQAVNAYQAAMLTATATL